MRLAEHVRTTETLFDVLEEMEICVEFVSKEPVAEIL